MIGEKIQTKKNTENRKMALKSISLLKDEFHVQLSL